MKKLRALLGAAAAVLLCAAVFLPGGRRPFQDLEAADIVSAVVCLTPPDRTVQITDRNELADYLSKVVIHQEDNSYTEYCGQSVNFRLTLSDGTQTEVMAYNPFLVIDGVGYRTEYEPCEALNQYANRLLDREDAVIVMEEPPALAVMSDKTSHRALLTSWSWTRLEDDGSGTSVIADAAHPLEYEKDLLPPLETTEGTAALHFTEEPDEVIRVYAWSDAHWGEPSAEREAVTVSGYEIELKPGGYIYEVQAGWNADSGYGGTANYCFYVNWAE